MPNQFGDAFKAAVQKSGKKDLSQHSIADLFPVTTQAADILPEVPERGDLGQAIKDYNREEETDGNE